MIEMKRRGGPGRSRLKAGERLEGYGLHLRSVSLLRLREITAWAGRTVRDYIESNIARDHARLAKREPFYQEWVDCGRPIPVAAWLDSGRPARWDGERLPA